MITCDGSKSFKQQYKHSPIVYSGGNDSNCPLCNALSEYSIFKVKVYDILKSRLEWVKTTSEEILNILKEG